MQRDVNPYWPSRVGDVTHVGEQHHDACLSKLGRILCFSGSWVGFPRCQLLRHRNSASRVLSKPVPRAKLITQWMIRLTEGCPCHRNDCINFQHPGSSLEFDILISIWQTGDAREAINQNARNDSNHDDQSHEASRTANCKSERRL